MSARAYAGSFAWPSGGATIDRYLRVRNNAGVLDVSGAADEDVGLLAARIDGQNEVGTVTEVNPGSVYWCVGGDGIAAGATVNKAAGGKVTTAGANAYGIALDAGSGDGSIIRVLKT